MNELNSDQPASMLRARLTRAAGFLLAGLWASSTQAMPNYPGEIQAHLQLSYTPQCTLCHATPQGSGPVTTKFGTSMVAVGLTTNDATLIPCLDKLQSDGTDSNGDGIPDIVALQDGLDPSTGAARSDAPTMKYGCGARIATGTVRSNAAVAALTLAMLGMVLLRRHRAR